MSYMASTLDGARQANISGLCRRSATTVAGYYQKTSTISDRSGDQEARRITDVPQRTLQHARCDASKLPQLDRLSIGKNI